MSCVLRVGAWSQAGPQEPGVRFPIQWHRRHCAGTRLCTTHVASNTQRQVTSLTAARNQDPHCEGRQPPCTVAAACNVHVVACFAREILATVSPAPVRHATSCHPHTPPASGESSLLYTVLQHARVVSRWQVVHVDVGPLALGRLGRCRCVLDHRRGWQLQDLPVVRRLWPACALQP